MKRQAVWEVPISSFPSAPPIVSVVAYTLMVNIENTIRIRKRVWVILIESTTLDYQVLDSIGVCGYAEHTSNLDYVSVDSVGRNHSEDIACCEYV